MINIKFLGTNQVELVNSVSGTTISPTSSGDDFIEFNVAGDTLSKDNRDYYHFVIPSTVVDEVTVSGIIDGVTTKHQYVNLFKDCYQITDASQLQFNGNIMRQFCYSNMFLNCTGLITPPTTLSAQNLDDWCYAGMFAGCENMTTAPSLPASNLAKYCYYAMFYNCKSLSSTINLPAPDLKEFCYDSMFWGCQNITNITIHGADLFEGSCANMFVKCSNLSAIHLFAGNWDTVANTSAHCNATNVWCYDVPTSLVNNSYRDFYCIQQLPFTRGYNYIPNNWHILYSKPMLFKSTGNTTVSFDKVGNPYSSKFRYSINWGPVSTYTLGQPIQLSDGDELTFRGDRTLLSKDSNNYYRFATSGDGKLIVSGTLYAMSRHTKPTSGTYRNMFENCTNITNAYRLSGFEYVADTSHALMFKGCTSLTACPTLPATELYANTYASMFSGCTALRIPPELPATGLANYSYYKMFEGCTSLVTPPALPASTLATQCYYRMFAGCSNLTGAPTLPATTLAQQCYAFMFYGCSSLVEAPILPATTVATSAYAYMFNRCSKLNIMDVNFSTWGSSGEVGNDTYGWAYGVASKGDFYKPDGLSTVFGNSRIPTGWRPQHKYLTFTSKSANAYINLEKVGSPNDITLKYKKNSGSWTNYTIGNSISLTSGQTVSFSGANDHFSLDGSNRYTFKLTGNVEADGNIQSLMNYSNTLTENCYRSLFLNCSSLLTPPALPVTTLATGCYRGMFNGCSKLSTAPYLPAKTLAQYCYYAMFEECSGLVSVQTTLPATTLATGCYMAMFNFCSKLSTAPTLPATTCVPSCYSHMFKDCTALTSAPQLPAKTLARSCYSSMFRDCKNIKVAPRISNAFPYQASYYSMFAGCSKLSSIEVDFDSWDLYDYQNATYGWVSGVASTGTFKKPSALTTTRGVSYIPTNWSIVNK